MTAYYHSSDKYVNTLVGERKDLIHFMEETEGSRLQRLRKKAKLTQEKLAERAGCSTGTIGNIESGLRGYGESVVGIARALEVTPEYLQMVTDDLVVVPALPGYSVEALALAWLLDQIPDRLTKTKANHDATAAILAVLNQLDAKPIHTPIAPASPKKQPA